MRATALFEGPHTQAGRTDTYEVRPERVKECLENLNKGAGSGTGSILALGNTWRDQESGALSIGWINTAISAQKAKAELNHHHHRRIEQVFAQMPMLDFTNVYRAPGEPERVRWSLGLDSINPRVQIGRVWQTVTFDRDWLKDKLKTAWESRSQDKISVNLRLPVLYPEKALPVTDRAGAVLALNDLLAGHPYRSVLTRISTEDAVETRWQPLMRGENVTQWSANLLSQAPGYDDQGRPVAHRETGEQILVDRFSLIQGINNDLLFKVARRAGFRWNSCRAIRYWSPAKMPWVWPTTSDRFYSRNPPPTYAPSLSPSAMIPEAVARVALVFQQQNERTYVVSGPFRLETGPSYALATVPSSCLALPVHVPADAAPAPAAAAPGADSPLESAKVEDIPPLGEEDEFSLDGMAIEAALDGHPAATTPPVAMPSPTLAVKPVAALNPPEVSIRPSTAARVNSVSRPVAPIL
ncbi:MAG: hypothetical protein IPL59_13875 [Candidatus Competibacteraceae bacterium]|nr:hypothetical protein [Candidatus Competibacteraceae bacterium]